MRNIGELRETITIKKRVVDNSAGYDKEVLEHFIALRAAFWGESGKEFMSGGSTYERKRAIFTVRKPNKKRLNTGMVIEYRGLDYKIVEIIPNVSFAGMLDLRAENVRMEEEGATNGY